MIEENELKERLETSTHAEDLKFRLITVELLRTAKKRYTYRQLAEKTNLPITVLSRYAKGHVLPNSERARQLWTTLSKIVGLETELRRRIKFNREGYFDNTSIVGDINILRQAANYALARFAGRRVTKVLTAAVDGVPLATMISSSLGVNLVVAKCNKEVGVSSFFEETYVLDGSGVTMTLYMPRDAIKRRDSVLVVDDTIKSGDTQAALVNLVYKAKAEISGVFSMIALGDAWHRKLKLPEDCPVEILLRLEIPR
ncbi:MAG: adenine phosphoribosyltransferase [Candidatus Bathyarchaeia archaeon]